MTLPLEGFQSPPRGTEYVLRVYIKNTKKKTKKIKKSFYDNMRVSVLYKIISLTTNRSRNNII